MGKGRRHEGTEARRRVGTKARSDGGDSIRHSRSGGNPGWRSGGSPNAPSVMPAQAGIQGTRAGRLCYRFAPASGGVTRLHPSVPWSFRFHACPPLPRGGSARTTVPKSDSVRYRRPRVRAV